jgi:hypothetical protein
MTETAEIRILRLEAKLDRILRIIEGPALVSRREAARLLGISPQTLDRKYVATKRLLIERGKIRRSAVEALCHE